MIHVRGTLGSGRGTAGVLLLLMWTITTLSVGCTFVGPAGIRGGRMAYNEAIMVTNDQQVLSTIVRMRYGESTSFLAVSSITASMQFRASAGAQVGVGPSDSYETNLIPLSAGVAYEESPTISYTPVQGQEYMRQLLSSLPIDLTILMLNGLHSSAESMTLLLRSINGIMNPGFVTDPTAKADPRFARVVELLAKLGREQRSLWAQSENGFSLLILNDDEVVSDQISELYELLGVQRPVRLGGVVVIPARLGVGRPEDEAVHLDTRSLWDLLQLAAASVDVAPEHLESGIAPTLPPVGPAGKGIRIKRSKKAPKTAVTAIKHRGWWFYVDETDTMSKQTFRILEALISERVIGAVDHGKSTPVLTVPVSR